MRARSEWVRMSFRSCGRRLPQWFKDGLGRKVGVGARRRVLCRSARINADYASLVRPTSCQRLLLPSGHASLSR
jgi:hypothetical protein